MPPMTQASGFATRTGSNKTFLGMTVRRMRQISTMTGKFSVAMCHLVRFAHHDIGTNVLCSVVTWYDTCQMILSPLSPSLSPLAIRRLPIPGRRDQSENRHCPKGEECHIWSDLRRWEGMGQSQYAVFCAHWLESSADMAIKPISFIVNCCGAPPPVIPRIYPRVFTTGRTNIYACKSLKKTSKERLDSHYNRRRIHNGLNNLYRSKNIMIEWKWIGTSPWSSSISITTQHRNVTLSVLFKRCTN